MQRACICVFAKPPRPGEVKTRLMGRRFMARPFYYATLMNVLPVLYRVGVPAARLARAYGDVR